jgi:hypothetical protein
MITVHIDNTLLANHTQCFKKLDGVLEHCTVGIVRLVYWKAAREDKQAKLCKACLKKTPSLKATK